MRGLAAWVRHWRFVIVPYLALACLLTVCLRGSRLPDPLFVALLLASMSMIVWSAVGADRCRKAAAGVVRTTALRESLVLTHDPGTVWSLIWPAENAGLLSADGTGGEHVAGTPLGGVGEQQRFTLASGATLVHETIACLEARHATTTPVSRPRGTPRLHIVHDLVPHPLGTELSVGLDLLPSRPAYAFLPEFCEAWHTEQRAYLARVAALLDGGWRPGPGSRGTPIARERDAEQDDAHDVRP